MFKKNLLFLSLQILVISVFFADAFAEEEVVTTAPFVDDDAPNQTQSTIKLQGAKLKFNEFADILNQVSGVSTLKSGVGQPSYIAIRGGNPRQNRLRWNGLKLSLPFGPGFDFSTLDTVAFETITVLKAGASSHRGQGALTGAIELNSGPMANRKMLERSISYGSFNSLNLALKIGVVDKNDYGVLSLGTQHSDGDFPFIDRQGTSHIRVGNESRRIQIASTFGHLISKKWKNKTSLLYANVVRGAPGPSEFQDAFLKAKTKISQVFFSHVLTGNRLENVFTDRAQAKFHVGLSGSDYRYENPEAFLGGKSISSDTQHRRISGASRIRFFSDSFLITLGSEVGFDQYETLQFENELEKSQLEKSRLELSARASTEYYWNDSLSSFTTFSVDRVGDSFLPNANLGFVLNFEPFSLVLNGAKSSRSPDLDELYLQSEGVRGNPNLENESAWTGDLGLRLKSDYLDLEHTLFVSRIENTILFLPISSFVIEAQNIGNFLSFGVENNATLKLDSFLFDAWYTVTIAQKEDIQTPHQPVHKGGFRANFELALQRYSFEKIVLFLDANLRSEVNLDLFANLKNEAAFRLNLGLRTQMKLGYGMDIHISLGVKNLLDDQRQEDLLQRPLPGRQIFGSVQFEL